MKLKIKVVEMQKMVLEQYQCETCGRFFYINKGDKSSFDINYGCPYGCDDAGRHTRTLTVIVDAVEDAPVIAKCQSCGSENLELIDDERDIYLCGDCGNTQTPML